MENTAAQAVPSQKKFWIGTSIVLIILLIGSFAGSFYLFRQYRPKLVSTITPSTNTNPDALPATDCPINGEKYTNDQAAKWQDHRPIGVMIENNIAARPQSGISQADVVYEAVAEGGITRFMAIFYCQAAQDADVTVGPVRSARTYFLDWISEYDGLYAHVGGANEPGPADALGQIIRYGIHDINQFNYDYPTFWRDQKRLSEGFALEHTMYSSTAKLWDLAENKLGWGAVDQKTGTRWDANFQNWYFIDDPKNATGSAQTVTIPFWDKTPGDYTVKWTYDPANKVYKRVNGGTTFIDANTNQQVTTKNIIIQFMQENHANDGYPGNQHLVYGTIGSGDAWIIQDGNIIKGTWKKQNRTARTKYYDAAGNEIGLVRGQIWIETVPTYDESSVKVQ